MDICDQADLQNEVAVTAALSQRRPEGPAANGRCHNCNEKLPKGMKYCDGECRKDHEYRERMRRVGR